MSIVVSIILCTRNRAATLAETLESIGHCQVPADLPTEVLIIDNGSSDHTASVAADARLPQMSVRYMREDRTGKCIAYNSGLAQAKGEIFLFTDDDVRLPVDWVERMCRPILEGAADVTAGSVRMAGHLTRPWMKSIHRCWLAEVDLSRVESPGGFIGANFACSRRILQRVPGFDVRLGPGALGFCDDNLFAAQISQAGSKIISAGDCFVEHHFAPDRLLRGSLLDRAWKQGESGAYMAYHWIHRPCKLVRARIALWWSLRALRRCQYAFNRPPQEGCPEWELRYTETLAYAVRYARERRLPPKYPSQRVKLADASDRNSSRVEAKPI